MAIQFSNSQNQSNKNLAQNRKKISEQYIKMANYAKEHNQSLDITEKEFTEISRQFSSSSFVEVLEPLKKSVILRSAFTNTPEPKYADGSSSMTQVLEKLYDKGFYDRLNQIVEQGTKKSNTGSSLIQNAINVGDFHFNNTKLKSNESLTSVLTAAQNIKHNLDNKGYIGTFDLETLGGVNQFGYHELDGITEFSYTIRKANKNKSLDVVKSINNVVGISDDSEAQNIINYIENLDMTNLTDKDKVNLSRYSKYGSEKTKYEIYDPDNYKGYSHGAAWKVTNFDDTNYRGEDLRKNAIEGVKQLNKIGKAQSKAASIDGKRLIDVQFKDMINIMNGKDSTYSNIVSSGYNSINFDEKMLNRYISKHYGMSLDIPQGQHFDMFQARRLINQINGATSLSDEDYSGRNKKEGLNTQKQVIDSAYGESVYEGRIAHVAQTDEDIYSLLFHKADKNNEVPFERILKELTDIKSSGVMYEGKYEGPHQQLFLLSNTDMHNSFNRSSGLSYRWDPISKTFKTFNGYEIGKPDGLLRTSKVNKTSFNQAGPKKKGLYTREIIQLENSQEFKELFNAQNYEGTMPEYNINKMFAVVTKPFKNEEEGYYVQFFPNEEDVEASLAGVDVAKLKNNINPYDEAVRNNLDNYIVNEQALKHPDLQIREIINGETFTRRPELEDIAEIANIRQKNDTAARYMKSMSYGKYKRAKKGSAELRKLLPGDKTNREQELSKLIAQGKPLTLQLLDSLGYTDFSAEDLKKTITSNTVVNTINAMDYLDSAEWMYDSIVKEIDNTFTGPRTSRDVKAKMSWSFSRGINAAMEALTQDVSPEQILNGKPVKNFISDLNYVEFSRDFLFNEQLGKRQGRTIAGASEDLVRINLDNGASLLNTLFENKYGNSTNARKKGNHGFQVLYDFIKDINSTDEYKDAINISEKKLRTYQQDENAEALSHDITKRLKEFVLNKREESDTTFGILDKNVFYHDVLNVHDLLNNASDDTKTRMITAAKNAIKETPNVKYLSYNDTDIDSTVEDIINRITMPIKRSDYIKQLNNKDLSQTDIKSFLYQYDMTRKSVKEKTSDMVKSITNAGGDISLLIANDKKNSLVLLKGNDYQDQITLPAVKSKNGILHVDIDGNNYTIASVLNTNKVKRGSSASLNSIGVDTTYGRAMNSSYGSKYNDSYSLSAAMNKTMKNKKDPSSQFISGIANWKKNLRNNSIAIDTFNTQAFNTQLEMDINGIVEILPELKSTISVLERKGVIDPDMRKELNRVMNVSLDKKRKASLRELSSTERNIFVEHGLLPILQEIGKNTSDEKVKHFMSNLNFSLKDTHVASGKLSVGYLPFGGLSMYDAQSKPTLNQASNIMYYNKNKVNEAINKDKNLKGSVRTGTIITNNKTESYMGNYTDDVSKETVTGIMSTKYINLDNDSFKDIIVNEKEKIDNVFEKKAKELGAKGADVKRIASELYDDAQHANLYEQEMLLYSRMHDTVFNKQNLQAISKRKELILTHENQVQMIKQFETASKLKLEIKTNPKTGQMEVSYNAGKIVKGDDHLFSVKGYNDSKVPYSAKYDGTLKGLYFDNTGEIVDPSVLNKRIQGLKTEKEITEKLDSLFDFKYAILPKYDSYGAKVFQSTAEKGVSNTLKTGLGTYDEVVRESMKKLGFKDDIGRVYHSSFLQDFFKTIDNNESLLDVSATELKERILRERHAVGDVIFRGIDKLNFNANLISDQNWAGHGHVTGLLKSTIGNLYENGLLKDNDKDILKHFKGIKATIKDGVLHTSEDLQGTSINIEGFMTEAEKRLKEAGKDLDIKDDNGKKIGFVGWTETLQVSDNLGGTNQGIVNFKDVMARKEELKKEVENANTILKTAIGDEKTKQILIRDKALANLDEMQDVLSAEGKIHRGLKYSDRTHLTLNRARYSESYLKNMKAYLPEEEYKELVKNIVDENGNVKEALLGKSVLQNYTDSMKEQVFRGDGVKTLADLTDAEKKTYSHILSRVNPKEYGDISVEKAKLMYSIGSGSYALDFNQNYSQQKLNNFVEEGVDGYKFKKIGIDELDLDIGGQKNTIFDAPNNPYSNEVMVDLGEEFSGSSRYLAVGRGLERVSGDGIIKENHVQMLGTLKAQSDKLYNDTTLTQEEKEKVKSNILTTREKFIEQQQKDISGKDGFAGDLLEVRYNESHYGKAGTLTFNVGDNKAFNALSSDDKYRVLQKKNGTVLDKAYFGDKSIMQHYSEGKYIDSQFRSEKAFRDMGYFDEDIMNKRLKNIDKTKFGLDDLDLTKLEDKETATRRLLEKYGDVVITDRFPEIQEGSVKPSMMYLDRKLKDNEARAVSFTGASMKLDNDGDQFFAARMKTRAGNSYLDKVVGSIGSEKDKHLDELIESERTYMMSRAVGQNKYFEAKVQKALNDIDPEELVKNAALGNQWNNITLGNRIDGAIHPALGSTDHELIKRSISNVESYKETAAKNLNIENVAIIKGKQAQEFNDEVVRLIKESDPKKSKSLIKDFVVDRQYDALRTEQYSKILKDTVGEVNTASFKYRKLFDTFMDTSQDAFGVESNMLQSILYQAEEAAISAKKVGGNIKARRARDFTSALNGVLNGKDVNSNLSSIEGWIRENIYSKVKDEADLIRHIDVDFNNNFKAGSNEAADEIIKRVTSNMRALSTNDGVRQLRDALTHNFGNSIGGIQGEQLLNLITADSDNSILSSGVRSLQRNNMLKDIGSNISGNNTSFNAGQSLGEKRYLVDGAEWLKNERSAGQQVENVLKFTGETFSNIAKNVTGKSLAIGALGLAGSFLVAGFVGGNPARPADTQAMEDADDSLYEIPSLQDEGLQSGQRQQQGYVVNINARTDRGREQVQNALGSAMRSSTPTDVNINMNINEDNGNINSRYLEQLLAGAI